MESTTITLGLVALNLYGTYNSTELPVIAGIDGKPLSPYQTEIHVGQYSEKPEYQRLQTGTDYLAFLAEIDRNDTGGRAFSVNHANVVRLSESEPESLTLVDSVKVHNERSLDTALRVAILKYSRLADYVSVDFHRGTAYIQVYRSSFFGSSVVGL
jgi:hypothetical protein